MWILKKYPVIIVWTVVIIAQIVFWVSFGDWATHRVEYDEDPEYRVVDIGVENFYVDISHYIGEYVDDTSLDPTLNPADVARFAIIRVNFFGIGLVLYRMFPMFRNHLMLGIVHIIIFTLVLLDMLISLHIFTKKYWTWGHSGIINVFEIMFIALYFWSFQTFIFCPARTLYTRGIYIGLHAFLAVLNWMTWVILCLDVISGCWLQFHYTSKENQNHKGIFGVIEVYSVLYGGVYLYSILIFFIIINPYFE